MKLGYDEVAEKSGNRINDPENVYSTLVLGYVPEFPR